MCIAPGENAQETSQPGYEADPELLRAFPGLAHPGEPVVVGERQGGAASGRGQVHDLGRGLRPVRACRVQVQVDHVAERTARRLLPIVPP